MSHIAIRLSPEKISNPDIDVCYNCTIPSYGFQIWLGRAVQREHHLFSDGELKWECQCRRRLRLKSVPDGIRRWQRDRYQSSSDGA